MDYPGKEFHNDNKQSKEIKEYLDVSFGLQVFQEECMKNEQILNIIYNEFDNSEDNQYFQISPSFADDIVTFRQIKDKELKHLPEKRLGEDQRQTPQDQLTYKFFKSDQKLIKSILEHNKFQKVNHFPNSTELTKKDRLCYNIVKMQEKYSKQDFDIVPDTYILPEEFADFYCHFNFLKANPNAGANLWIVKPAAKSQGKGIYLVSLVSLIRKIDDISEAPIDEYCVVSRYIANPLLINGLKFDLRLYVLVTSFEPLKIYIYNDGLVRFASEEYNSNKVNKGNRFSHLTNYSINKKNDKFVQNANKDADDIGNKWSIQALCKHLEQNGIATRPMWNKIYDLIIKSLISVDSQISQSLKKLNPIKNNCFEIYGYDIIIDQDLKPWLLEVNQAPSLACDSPLDFRIKSQLITDSFNLALIKKFEKRVSKIIGGTGGAGMGVSGQQKQKSKSISKHSGSASKTFSGKFNRNSQGPQYQRQQSAVGTSGALNLANQISGNNQFQYDGQGAQKMNQREENSFYSQTLKKLKTLNPRMREHIKEFLLEDKRRGNFIRIYPSKNSNIYDKYFEPSKISNRQLHRLLYHQSGVSTGGVGSGCGSTNLGSEDSSPIVKRPKKKKSSKQTMSKATTQESQSSVITESKQGKRNSPSEAKSSLKSTTDLDLSRNSDFKLSKDDAVSSQGTPASQKAQDKLLITGDDVLIEYAGRLMIAIRSFKESTLKSTWRSQIERFITHYVWHTSDMRRQENNQLWQRLESRLIEMKERRKRLLKQIYAKEAKSGGQDFHLIYEKKEQQKNIVIQGFSASQLEEMLRTSTKNVAHEVVSCLVDTNSGILTEIIAWLTSNATDGVNEDKEIDSRSILDSKKKYLVSKGFNVKERKNSARNRGISSGITENSSSIVSTQEGEKSQLGQVVGGSKSQRHAASQMNSPLRKQTQLERRNQNITLDEDQSFRGQENFSSRKKKQENFEIKIQRRQSTAGVPESPSNQADDKQNKLYDEYIKNADTQSHGFSPYSTHHQNKSQFFEHKDQKMKGEDQTPQLNEERKKITSSTRGKSYIAQRVMKDFEKEATYQQTNPIQQQYQQKRKHSVELQGLKNMFINKKDDDKVVPPTTIKTYSYCVVQEDYQKGNKESLKLDKEQQMANPLTVSQNFNQVSQPMKIENQNSSVKIDRLNNPTHNKIITWHGFEYQVSANFQFQKGGDSYGRTSGGMQQQQDKPSSGSAMSGPPKINDIKKNSAARLHRLFK